MIKKFLKIAGVKNEQEFYKKYPTEAAFFKAHPEAKDLKKNRKGGELKKLDQLTRFQDGGESEIGSYMETQTPDIQPIQFGEYMDYYDKMATGSTQAERDEAAAQQQSSSGGGLGDMISQILPMVAGMKHGGGIPKAQNSIEIPGNNNTGGMAFDPWGGTTSITGAPPPMAVPQTTLPQLNPIYAGTAAQQAAGSAGASPIKFVPNAGGTDILGNLGGAAGIAGIATDLIGGIQGIADQRKAMKEAEKQMKVAGIVEQAAATRPEQARRRYVTHEDMVFQPEQMSPSYGTGYNAAFAAKNGTEIGGNPTEIQNMYNPGDIYSGLAYEPLDDSNVKQFQQGGQQNKFDWEAFAKGGGNQIANALGSKVGGGSAWGQVGGAALGAVGTAIGGPVGGMIGKFAGQALGALDPTARKMKEYQEKTQRSIQNAGLMSATQGLQSQYSGYMEDGGELQSYRDFNQSAVMRNESEFTDAMDRAMQMTPTTYLSEEGATSQTSSAPAAKPKVSLKDYKGVSVSDFLATQGKANDYQSRKELAKKLGISDYRGTASQNTKLMNMIKENPDVLSDYKAATRSSSSGKAKSETGKRYTQKEIDAINSGLIADAKKWSSQKAPTTKEAMDYIRSFKGTASYNPEQAYISQGKTPVTGSSTGKVDPYLRLIEQDPQSEANIISRNRGEFARDLAIGTLGPLAAESALMAATTRYLPYGLRAIPEVTAASRHASRAIPYATRALGYREGGWISHDWQPQVITKFGEYDVKDLLKPDPMMDTLRSGGNIRQNYMFPQDKFALGGELQTHWGGDAESMSYNPYLPDGGETVMFRGQSHDESDGYGRTGIGVTYGENPVEVERGEPALKLKDGSSGDSNLVVYGDLKINEMSANEIGDPESEGMRFKHYVRDLSNDERKQNKLVDRTINLMDDTDENTPFGKLTMGSAMANMMGASMKLKDIADKKTNAAAVQNAINETSEEMGLKASDLAIGKITQQRYNPNIAQDGKKIKKSEVSGYLKEGYVQDPNNPNRLVKKGKEDIIIPGKAEVTKTVPGGTPPKKGSAEFNKAFGEARKKGLKEFTWKGKTYGTEMYSPKGKTVVVEAAVPERKETKEYEKDVYIEPEQQAAKKDEIIPATKDNKFDWGMLAGQIMPFLRPTDAEALDYGQLSKEMLALATNQLEPVQAQLFTPELATPYDISLQDQLNEITANQRSAERMAQGDPSALSAIAAQSNMAKSKVLGEQFRLNQAQKAAVYNDNRQAIMDARKINLGILDQQYARQSEVRSKTKNTALEAVGSIADKIAKNKLENRTLQVYENMYNYRYDPKFRAINWNAPYMANIPQISDKTLAPVYDKDGKFMGYKMPSEETATTTSEETTAKAKFGKSVSKKSKLNSSIVKAFKNI